MSARLADLFPEAAGPAADLTVSDLTADSRQVATGTVFVAVPGTKADGRRFAVVAFVMKDGKGHKARDRIIAEAARAAYDYFLYAPERAHGSTHKS